jgi:hypothetical protein
MVTEAFSEKHKAQKELLAIGGGEFFEIKNLT